MNADDTYARLQSAQSAHFVVHRLQRGGQGLPALPQRHAVPRLPCRHRLLLTAYRLRLPTHGALGVVAVKNYSIHGVCRGHVCFVPPSWAS